MIWKKLEEQPGPEPRVGAWSDQAPASLSVVRVRRGRLAPAILFVLSVGFGRLQQADEWVRDLGQSG